MTRDLWLAAHPYLQPVADLHASIDAAAASIPVPSAQLPNWDDYTGDFLAGVPLLHSSSVAIDFGDLDSSVASLIARLASTPLPGKLDEACRALRDTDSRSPALTGLLRYLRSNVLVRYLGSVTGEFAKWRDEERWLRSYCPLCGELPAMAQLIGSDPGRLRLLVCGCCKTRWRYRRTGCPFCERRDDHRLAVVAVEGESGLRIDYCAECNGYLKTYSGEGNEAVLLADWTSLHLDLIACDRGLKRLAASLYSF
jgi:FdhE protein